jgi:hypothetical protein
MFFSLGRPNIDSVIPAMDYLDQQLTTSALNTRYSKSIKAAITLGKKTLNRYYDLSDHSEIYCIAMGKSICLSLHSLMLLFLSQCCIHAISLTTSRELAGKMTGSQWHERSFTTSLSDLMQT